MWRKYNENNILRLNNISPITLIIMNKYHFKPRDLYFNNTTSDRHRAMHGDVFVLYNFLLSLDLILSINIISSIRPIHIRRLKFNFNYVTLVVIFKLNLIVDF